MRKRSIAVIGGGINGAGIAWELARKDYDVSLFDRGEFGAATSAASTKLIHGGIRYLEQGHVGLVRESLREREFLLAQLPELVRPVELVLPMYRDDGRSRIRLAIGLTLYDLLARSGRLPRHERLTTEAVLQRMPLRSEGLTGGFSFWDAQTDDRALVLRVVAAAVAAGAKTFERTGVDAIRSSADGVELSVGRTTRRFDALVNATGPWMSEWLRRNQIASRYNLSLVRGSHIVVDRPLGHSGALLQSPIDRRVIFVLPWRGKTLVGTTEVEQRSMTERVVPSEEELSYLIRQFDAVFEEPLRPREIIDRFAGVRPLVRGGADITSLSRGSKVEVNGRMVNVFGGKLTTFLALAREVGDSVDTIFAEHHPAAPPHF
jgi:glycerol-3-phosphate dehydrogenase